MRSEAKILIGIIVLVAIVIIVVALLFLFSWRAFSNKNDFGTWQTTTYSKCTNSTGLCDEVGTRRGTITCVPNPISGRGCMDENGMQTFKSQQWEEPCNIMCKKSKWLIEEGSCVDNLQLVNYTCVPNDKTGDSGCTLVQPVESSIGAISELNSYNVGDHVVLSRVCQSNKQLGSWIAKDGSNYTLEPGFSGQYILDDKCVTNSPYPFNLLQEGIVVAPMVCRTTNNEDLLPADEEPYLESCSVPTCRNDVIVDTSGEALSPTSQTIFCPETYAGHNPKYMYPCRFRPVTAVNLGQGVNLNALVNHFSILRLDSLSTIIAAQTPNTSYSYSPMQDWNRQAGDLLMDVPLSYTSPELNTRSWCTTEQASFNTGCLFVFGPREILSQTSFRCLIGIMIPSHYRGWLATRNIDGQEVAYWRQGADSVQGATQGIGQLSTQAQLFTVSVVSNLTKGSTPGYPLTAGTMKISIKTSTGAPIFLSTLEQDVSSNLNVVEVLLFSFETEICTRSLYGGSDSSNCNLYHSVSDSIENVTCVAPAIL